MSDTDPYAPPEEPKASSDEVPEEKTVEAQEYPSNEAESQPEAETSGASESEPEAAPDDEEVPEGTVNATLEWVGDDKDRAQRALDKEKASDDPRVTLIRELEDILDG